MVLATAQGHGSAQIAHDLDSNVDTVRLWRDRWVGLQGIELDSLSIAERLQDATALERRHKSARSNAVKWPR